MERLAIIHCSARRWLVSVERLPPPESCHHAQPLHDPLIQFSVHLAGKPLFLKAVQGYHQVPMHPTDISKMAVLTPFGLLEFQMPFSLKNAVQSFQRLTESALWDMPFIFVYLDKGQI